MSLLAFARSKERPVRQPGQKAVTGRVASHALILFQPAGPRALCVPWISMIRPETGRDNEGACPERPWVRRGDEFKSAAAPSNSHARRAR
jgi:hypothetical protein